MCIDIHKTGLETLVQLFMFAGKTLVVHSPSILKCYVLKKLIGPTATLVWLQYPIVNTKVLGKTNSKLSFTIIMLKHNYCAMIILDMHLKTPLLSSRNDCYLFP